MSGAIKNVREKLRRKLSMKEDQANVDEYDDPEDVDEETTGHIHKEIEKAEADEQKYPQGRPNSFLNRLISHGNKKTEDDLARSSQTNLAESGATMGSSARAADPAASTTAGQTTSATGTT